MLCYILSHPTENVMFSIILPSTNFWYCYILRYSSQRGASHSYYLNKKVVTESD